MKKDTYVEVTNRIVAMLQAGVRPWLKPWNAHYAANRHTCEIARSEHAELRVLHNGPRECLARVAFWHGGHLYEACFAFETSEDMLPVTRK